MTTDAPSAPVTKELRCGTLVYTRYTIVMLFGWLLWGDFCFTLMESVGNVIPLKMQNLGMPSFWLSLILTTLPAILNLTVCPWVSFKSDRHRGRFGRRIPFILYTMPFLCLSLIAIGWSEEISALVTTWIPGFSKVAPATMTMVLIGMFVMMFSFFNLFVNSVYWYLFNDVVPPHLLGRFTGLFRIVGTGTGAFYSGFIFPISLTYMREVMTGGALLYLFGFGLMCFFVKEGEYPPVPKSDESHISPVRDFVANFRIYMKESFSTRFYWYFYLSQAFFAITCCGGIFGLFLNLEMGLSMNQMGKLGMVGQIIGVVAVYFAAIYVDRWHPMRILTYQSIFGAITGFGGWIWLTITFPPQLYFWMNMGNTFVGVFAGALGGCCMLPAFMRLMPKSRYGQLSSANSMIRSAAVIVAGIVAGVFMDVVLKLNHGSTFGYRYLFLWFWLTSIPSTICYVLAYRKWQELGGDADYRAPAPWEPSGFEAVNDTTPSVPTIPRWLMRSLHMVTFSFVANIAMVPLLIFLMRSHGSIDIPLFKWHFAFKMSFMPQAVPFILSVYLPSLVLILALWLRLVHSIWSDLRKVAAGAEPRRGIPHHGVLMVMGIQGLFSLPIIWMQFIWLIHLGLQYELMIFVISSVLISLATILGYQLLRYLEAGHDARRNLVLPVAGELGKNPLL